MHKLIELARTANNPYFTHQILPLWFALAAGVILIRIAAKGR